LNKLKLTIFVSFLYLQPEVSVEAEALSSTEGVAEAEAAKPSAAGIIVDGVRVVIDYDFRFL
jgi:hypothetical protein